MHTIRLQHPWQCEPSGTGVCWSRSFNWPAGVSAGEWAWLVVEGVPDGASVALSGEPLVAVAPGRFDITDIIELHNRVQIELADGAPTDGADCPFDVRLEICEA